MAIIRFFRLNDNEILNFKMLISKKSKSRFQEFSAEIDQYFNSSYGDHIKEYTISKNVLSKMKVNA